MTLNQIIKRVETIALNHLQIRGFYHGFVSDYTDDRDSKYSVCILQNNGGSLNHSQHIATVNFRMFLLDMVHVSEDSKGNELDVQSDMMSIAMDLISEFNNSEYQDWRVETGNTIQFVTEEGPDYTSGIVMDISISAVWDINRCAVPNIT